MNDKNLIYDFTALTMFKRLEIFFNREFPSVGKNKPWGKKIEALKDKYPDLWAKHYGVLRRMPTDICDIRNSIVHPDLEAKLEDFSCVPEPILNLLKFNEFRKNAVHLDKMIEGIFGKKLRMGEIMLPTLPYDMGNAGDIIKHGVLSEFVAWWAKQEYGRTLKMADTFGGCPWGNIHPEVSTRIRGLAKTVLGSVQGKDQKYLGSSHLVSAIVKKQKLFFDIHVSDKDENAHSNWMASLAARKNIPWYNMEWINLPRNNKNFRKNDGYRILDDDQNPGQYDLILIDPFKKFLHDEFRNRQGDHFLRIRELTDDHPNLFVAVFVLDMHSSKSADKSSFIVREIGEKFANFKKTELADSMFSLRCPKIPGSEIRGESDYDSEILLISQQIRKDNCDALRKRLEQFADLAGGVLKEKVQFYGGDN